MMHHRQVTQRPARVDRFLPLPVFVPVDELRPKHMLASGALAVLGMHWSWSWLQEPVSGPRFAGGLLREPYYSVQEQLILLCLLLLRDVLSCGRAGQASFQAEV